MEYISVRTKIYLESTQSSETSQASHYLHRKLNFSGVRKAMVEHIDSVAVFFLKASKLMPSKPDTLGKVIRPFQVMAKPNGPRCNIDCRYCYYLEKEELYPETKKFRMSDEVLERFIRDYIETHDRLGLKEITFSWQGGEPTILGVDYFRRVDELEKKYCPVGTTVLNAFQTNGILIDANWASFFKEHGFLVGLSIDGSQDLHDRYRLDRNGKPTFDNVMNALRLLQKHDVSVNALTVVNDANAKRPKEVYRFLRDAGFEFIQFIPIVERSVDGITLTGAPKLTSTPVAVTPWSVSAKDYGNFLIGVFDEWLKSDVGRVYVQFFDVQLG
ncbi:MAG: radical SAM protein, partial [Betaproteobacteria bacterium]